MEAKTYLITPLPELKQQRQSTLGVIQKIKSVNKKLNYEGIQRINSTTLFQVKAKHTNQFTIQIGAGYFVQLTAQNAIKLLSRRLENIEQLIKKYEIHQQQKKNESTYGKVKTVSIQEGNKKSYMQVIGQENGQEIFNIVEIEGENQNDVVKSAENQIVSLQDKIKEQKNKMNKQELEQSHSPSLQVFDHQLANQNQNQDIEQQQLSQESQNQYGDLIHYHRQRIMGVTPQISSSSPEIPKQPKSKGIISMQQINPALPEKKKNKQKKRVSFADQVPYKIQEVKQQLVTTKQKQKQKQDKKQTKEQINNIEKTLNGKVSRFKLQRMKARMQKQDK